MGGLLTRAKTRLGYDALNASVFQTHVAVMLLALLAVATLSGCGTQLDDAGNAPIEKLNLNTVILDSQSLKDTGLDVSGESDRTVNPADLYPMQGTLGDYQRANMVQAQYRQFNLTQMKGSTIGILVIAYRTASWAQGSVETEAKSDADIGSGRRLGIRRSAQFNGMRLDGVKGRVRVIVQLSSTDAAFNPQNTNVQGKPVRAILETVWSQQTVAIPRLKDVPVNAKGGSRSITKQYEMRMAVSGGLLLCAVMALGQLAGMLRDRGSRELILLMFSRKHKVRPSPGMEVMDYSISIRQQAWKSFFLGVLKTVALSIGFGFLLYFLDGWQALGVIAVLLVLSVLIRLRFGWADGLPNLPRWAQTIMVLGAVGAELVVVAGCFMLVAAATGWQLTGASLQIYVTILIPMVIGGVAIMTRGRQIARFAQRLVQPAVRNAINADKRRPVMLLRSFQDDSLEVRSSSRLDGFTEAIATEGYARFEEILSKSLLKVGPLIALGQSGTVLQPLGAVREYFTDEQWQHAVEERNAQARFITVVCGRSPALMWEISEIRSNAMLAKTLFVIPPVPIGELRLRLRVLWSALSLPMEDFPDLSASYPLVLQFLESGRPCLHICRARTEAAYVTAMRQAVECAPQGAIVFNGPEQDASASTGEDVSDLLVSFDPKKVTRPRKTLARYLWDIASWL